MPNLLIDKICLRAQDDNGKWGSFTLHELLKMGKEDQALLWMFEKITGHKAGQVLTAEQLERLAQVLPKDSYVALK